MTNKRMKKCFYPGLLGKNNSALYFDSTSPHSELQSLRKYAATSTNGSKHLRENKQLLTARGNIIIATRKISLESHQKCKIKVLYYLATPLLHKPKGICPISI